MLYVNDIYNYQEFFIQLNIMKDIEYFYIQGESIS